MKVPFQILAISAVFVGLYVGLRALPDVECEFLHFEGSQVTVDGAEFCAVDNPIFLDLKKLSFPVTMSVTPDEPLSVGQKASFTVSVETIAGKPIMPQDLAIGHTQLLHLLIVDPSLSDYHHVHPEPIGLTGQWRFELTPAKSGTYQIFAEMVPTRTKRQVVAVASFDVPGAEEQPFITSGLEKAMGDYSLSLEIQPSEPTVGVDNELTLKVKHPQGEPVTLELVMGSFAHLVAFDENLDGYAHLHPKYTGKEKEPEPSLAFVLNTAKPGHYRVWAQLKLDGEERFTPFDLMVQ